MDRQSTTETPPAPFRLVIAGGGTGGHISPAVAVFEECRRRNLPVDPAWIGSSNSFEETAAVDLGIPFYTVRVGKLRRYLSLSTITDSLRIPAGIVEARRLIQRLRPDIILSTGGYVSVPTVIAGRSLHVPVLTHEQTASIGLATRINARFCDIVALSFPDAVRPSARPETRITVTGNPVRSSVLNGDAESAHSHFGLVPELPLVYVTGGAQGAHAINEVVGAALRSLLEHSQIIHQCGPDRINGDYGRLLTRKDQLPPQLAGRYRLVERVGEELRDIYAAATLVIGRAGAGTVSELGALGIPSVLIPLPGTEEQYRNASILADAGGSILLPQADLSPDRLIEEAQTILSDSARRLTMGQCARAVAPDDPAGKLVDELLSLLP